MPRLAYVAPLLLLPVTADAADALLSKRDTSQIIKWNSTIPDSVPLFHTTQCNDVDYNTAEGSELAWVVEHFNDDFGRFDIAVPVGLDAQFSLGDNGLTHYDYPKHVVVYNDELVIMSRNDGTLWRYSFAGVEIGSVKTPASTGQGMATDGKDLYVSLWNGGPSQFARYSEDFTILENFANPTGMAPNDNIFDLIYDPETQHFFGLATTGEQGTPTESDTVLEFTMGGAVVKTYKLPLKADGIGRFNISTCGDAVVEGDEQCDDGDILDDNACTSACKPNVCGDGFTWLDVEDCDDANASDSDECKNDCSFAFCGDAILWDGMEACDDGNKVDEDACTNACTLPACGDGIVQAGEECDDPDPQLCEDCLLVRPDSTTTTATTDTGDDTTGSTTAVDTTSGDETSSVPQDTTTDAPPATTTAGTSTGADSMSDSHGGSATGETPTSDGPPPDDTTTGDDASTSSGSGTAGTSSDDGCGCTQSGAPTLAPLLALLLLRRRRRATR